MKLERQAFPDKFRLLHGPYQAPPLTRGDRAVCLLRDTEVVITGQTALVLCLPVTYACGGAPT